MSFLGTMHSLIPVGWNLQFIWNAILPLRTLGGILPIQMRAKGYHLEHGSSFHATLSGIRVPDDLQK